MYIPFVRNHDRRRPCVLRGFAAILCGIALLGSTQVMAQEEKTVRVMTSPSGSGPYNTWATIQTHMDQFSDWLRISTEETPGFVYNVQIMGRDQSRYQDTVFGSGTVLSWVAEEGYQPFFDEPFEAAEEFMTLGVMGMSYNVFVTLDDDVKTPRDFPGKRIGIGMLSQNEWGMHPRMLLDGWELTDELRSLDTLGTFPNIEALLDGRTDVGFLFGLTSRDGDHTVVTGPHRDIEASGRDWHYVNVPREMTEQFVEETGAPFRVVEYEPNALPNQPDPLTTFGDLLVLQVHETFPEDAAYELVRVLVENHEQIGGYTAFARAWTPETLAYLANTDPENVHPGALRAYRDLGLVD